MAKLTDMKTMHIKETLFNAFAWETGLTKLEVTPGGGGDNGM